MGAHLLRESAIKAVDEIIKDDCLVLDWRRLRMRRDAAQIAHYIHSYYISMVPCNAVVACDIHYKSAILAIWGCLILKLIFI